MNYLENNSIINYFVIGDMNLYSSTEDAYQFFINYSNNNISLIDPGSAGQWHDNISFSILHSQSTHSENNSCFSNGGLDDRFDFILFSKSIQNDINKINYIQNSFEVIGQDGTHLNQALNNGVNISAPTNVINALYQNSDHLPVSLKIKVDQTPIYIRDINKQNISFFINGNLIKTNNCLNKSQPYYLSVYKLKGQCLLSERIINNFSNIELNVKKEIILLLIKNENQTTSLKYFIK
jgi:hypothetical protein